ncbi:MAG: hypothetical protein IPN92_20710 [Chromatiaceae bacterium]|nr:hypothetical protein [Chromatiaceae bacterium]
MGDRSVSAAFFVSHLGLAHPPVHDRIAGQIGEKGFQGLFLLATVLTLGAMITGYIYASHYVYLWIPGPGLRHLPLLAMPAFILIVGGVLTKNPSALGMEDSRPAGRTQSTAHCALPVIR